MVVSGSYLLVINVIVVVAFVFAFLLAENKGKLILAITLALLFLLPKIFPSSSLYWVYYAAKVIFGLACIIFFKWQYSR
jgi:hypothetical protein